MKIDQAALNEFLGNVDRSVGNRPNPHGYVYLLKTPSAVGAPGEKDMVYSGSDYFGKFDHQAKTFTDRWNLKWPIPTGVFS
jgi:hypothetical protein